MSIDLTSFILGLVLAGAVIVLTGFGGELGKDIYTWVKSRTGEPEPLKVSRGYVAKAYPPGECQWVLEEEITTLEDLGYFFYPHSKNRGGKCYRELTHGGRLAREYLMVKKQSV